MAFNFVPAGTILPFGGATAPAGWLLCDGSAISRTTYSALFAAISTAWGYGDNSTTFNLPDMRGRFPRGRDAGAARDPNAATRTAPATGGNTGDNVGSVQTQQLSSHNHQMYAFNGGSAGQAVGLSGLGSARAFYFNGSGSQLDFPAGLFIQNDHFTSFTGSGSTESRPININVNYIIKV